MVWRKLLSISKKTLTQYANNGVDIYENINMKTFLLAILAVCTLAVPACQTAPTEAPSPAVEKFIDKILNEKE